MNYTELPVYRKVRNAPEVNTYIMEQNKALKALCYTEHSFQHVGEVIDRIVYILETLEKDEHSIDLAATAALLHDIGNIVNRKDHSQSGAIMAFYLLNRLEIPAEDIARVICAIGNHDETTGVPVSLISAALILADKSDVRRSRVQETDKVKFDIHDRVNYSVMDSELKISEDHSSITLILEIDTKYGEVSEYFEIFMERMLMCKRAAAFLDMSFHLQINGQKLM